MSPWNQAPPSDQPQQAAGGSQDAQAEYAAWSADATYQQGAGQPKCQAQNIYGSEKLVFSKRPENFKEIRHKFAEIYHFYKGRFCLRKNSL